jgi:MFS family permease
MLAQAVLMGSAVAFLQFPAFAIVAQYFDKRRAAAMGLVASGSSLGGVVFPLVLSKLLNEHWVWVVNSHHRLHHVAFYAFRLLDHTATRSA